MKPHASTIMGLLLAVPALQTGAAQVSTFDQDTEGWQIRSFDAGACQILSDEFVPDFYPEAGNPGGCISAADPDGAWFVFSAPAEFLGDISWAYAGRLEFERRVESGTVDDAAFDVILSGGGMLLKHDSDPPLVSWTPSTAVLSEGSGWQKCNGSMPGHQEFASVIRNLDGIYILGDYRSGLGDRCWLDNVALQPGPTSVPGVVNGRDASIRIRHANPYSTGLPIEIANLPANRALTVSAFDLMGAKVTTLFYGTPNSNHLCLRWLGDPRPDRTPYGVYFLIVRTETERLGCSRLVLTRR
jgi:hypothetical protein